VSLLALIGVLLHAGLVARHNVSMVAAGLADQDLDKVLGVICHAETSSASSKSLPNVPDPNGKLKGCPICMGCISAAVVLPDGLVLPAMFEWTSGRIALVGKTIRYRMAALCPPSHGPPTFA